MSKNSSRFVSTEGTSLTLKQPGNYTIDFSGGNVAFSRGGTTSFTDAQFGSFTAFDFSAANKINLTGISFTEANTAVNNKFEPDANVDKMLKDLIKDVGVAGVVDLLTVDGSKAGVFKLIWDYVDDNYSYYNTEINTIGVELGLAYAEYLRAGGDPLTNVVAKYAPDGADAGNAPDRLQSMHDNLLGNLHIDSLIDKFFDGDASNGAPNAPGGYVGGGSNGGGNGIADEVTGQRLIDAIFAADLDGRPIYSGVEGTDPNPSLNFDYAHGLLFL